MQIVVAMEVDEAFKYLLKYALELGSRPLKSIVYQAGQVMRNKLENQVYPLLLPHLTCIIPMLEIRICQL